MNPPPPRPHHRRSHSDTTFRFSTLDNHDDDDDDDFLLDLDNFTLDTLPPSPSPPPQPPSTAAVEDDTKTASTVGGVAPHVRSLSVDADFFEGVSFGGERKGGHRRTSSMVGGLDVGPGPRPSSMVFDDGIKKAMPPETLAQLALIDPKRAKRILANRQSAARSKERKIRYTGELERRVQTLQTEATTLSAQVTLLQRDTTGLTIENKELTLRLQALEQQAQLRDALNEALRQEVQRLRIATGHIPPSSNNSSGGGMFSQYQAQSHNASSFGGPPKPVTPASSGNAPAATVPNG